MHEPAACGALPAQQASSHIDPGADADAIRGTLVDRHAISSISANTGLAVRTTVDRVDLNRFIKCILASGQKIRKALILTKRRVLSMAFLPSAVCFLPSVYCLLPTALCLPLTAYCLLLMRAPAGIRTPNQQIMRRFEGHQQDETKRDNPVFTESAAVKVS